jgi:hypothetical protein
LEIQITTSYFHVHAVFVNTRNFNESVHVMMMLLLLGGKVVLLQEEIEVGKPDISHWVRA